MKNLLLVFCAFSSVNTFAASYTFDFSGDELPEGLVGGEGYQVQNGYLIPPLVSDFYNNRINVVSPIIAGAGDKIVLSADFIYQAELVNPGPQEVAGLALIATNGGSDALGEVRALGSLNEEVVGYSVTYDVNSRNEGNPVVILEDDQKYRVEFTLDLVGGQFNDKSLLTTELVKLGDVGEELISTFTVDSYNHRLFTSDEWQITLAAQGSAGIGGIETFTVSTVPIPAAAWLFGSALVGLVTMSYRRRLANG